MIKTILKIGSGFFLGGITYLISRKSFEKEKEYNEIINGESSQTLQLFQLLLQRSQEITIELYNQSKQIINE